MRFATVIAAFALLNVLAWVALQRWWVPRTDLLTVTPLIAENGWIQDGRSLGWRFSLPMAAGPGPLATPPGTLEPAVPGTWTWSDEVTLVFTAARALPPATPFTATLARRHLRALAGFTLADDAVLHARTAPLRLLGAMVAAHEADGRQLVELTFSDRVLPDELLAHLSAADDDGHPLVILKAGEPEVFPASDGGDRAGFARVRALVGPVALPARAGGRHAHLRLRAGLAGTGGPLGLEADEERTLDLGRNPHLQRIDSRVPSRGQAKLELSFDGAVTSEVLRRALRVAPAVPFTVVADWRGCALEGDFQPGTRYAVTIAPPPDAAAAVDWPAVDTIAVTVGDREPACWFDLDHGYLGASGARSVVAHAVNLSQVTVTIARVVPEQLVAWRASGDLDAFASQLASRTIAVPAGTNQVHDLRLALDDLLPGGAARDGVYQVQVSARNDAVTVAHEHHWWWRLADRSVVSLSDLALSGRSGADAVDAWVLSLRGAAPQAGVRVRLFSVRGEALGEAFSGGDGLARLPFAGLPEGERPGFLVAERAPIAPLAAPDLTWLDLRGARLRDDAADTSGAAWLRHGHEAFLYCDRGVYRPGETVHLRALVRGQGGAVPPAFPVEVRVLRPDQRLWRSLAASLDADGDAELTLPLTDDLPTGRWSVSCGLPGDGHVFGGTSFQVEDFLPDRLRTTLAIGGPGVAVGDDDEARRIAAAVGACAFTAHGDWLFGQPAGGQGCRLDLRLDPLPFAPPAWRGWSFGDADALLPGRRLATRTATLDAQGVCRWTSDLAAELAGAAAIGPWRLTATAGVSESSGRTTGATRRLAVDPVDRYLGLRLAGTATAGLACPVELRLVTPAGAAATADDELEVQLQRVTWETVLIEDDHHRGSYQSRRRCVDSGAAQHLRLASGAARIDLPIPASGAWRLAARDLATGQLSALDFQAGGEGWEGGGISRERPERCLLALVADQRSDPTQALALPAQEATAAATALRAQRGDRLALVVRSPFAGRLLVTVATDRVLLTRVLAMDGAGAVVPLVVGDDWTPNAWISATVVRGVDPTVPWRIHRAFGVVGVAVAEPARRAELALSAPQRSAPGAPLAIDLEARDAAGLPLADAAVTIAAVDEGVLRLTGFRTPDPFAFFTARRALGVLADDCYAELLPESGRTGGLPSEGGDAAAPSPHRPPVAARRVRPVALWRSGLRTGGDGRLHAVLDLPEAFAGELRLMAVVDRGPATAAAARPVTVRGALVVQSSWPRCASPGDRFSVLASVTATGLSGRVHLALEGAEGAAPLRAAAAACDCDLDAGGHAEARFAITAAQATGVARLRLVASQGDARAIEELELPVRPASAALARGDEQVAVPGQPLRVALPGGLLAGADRTLRVHVGPAPAFDLPRGLDELYRYPYGCAEQTVSAVFPLLALGDLDARLGRDWFPADGLRARVRAGILRLQTMETGDGGLAMWPGGGAPWEWATVYATHFLLEVRAGGGPLAGDVPADFLGRLLDHVQRLAGSADGEARETAAYACYVLARAGRPDAVAMHRLGERLPDLAGGLPWLAAAWLATGRRDLAAPLLPELLPAPRADRHDGGDLASPVRDLAAQALALLDCAPQRPGLDRLIARLAAHDSWSSTQDTAWALLAIGRWLRVHPPGEACSHAELLVDGRTVAQADAGGVLSWAGGGADALELRVSGPPGARAHLSWLQTGVPLAAPPEADHGLSVRRAWFDEHDHEVGGRALVAGELVRVVLTVRAATRCRNVVVEDILPAGLEIENPRLATSADQSSHERHAMEVRDDRVIVIGDCSEGMGDGLVGFTHAYLVRAITPGTFARAAVHAECMYDRSCASTAGSGTTVVEARAP